MVTNYWILDTNYSIKAAKKSDIEIFYYNHEFIIVIDFDLQKCLLV